MNKLGKLFSVSEYYLTFSKGIRVTIKWLKLHAFSRNLRKLILLKKYAGGNVSSPVNRVVVIYFPFSSFFWILKEQFIPLFMLKLYLFIHENILSG